MNLFSDLEIIQRVGWTLVHSLWQLTIVVAAVIVLNTILARCRASVRYLVGCVGLLACVVVPVVTYATLEMPNSTPTELAETPSAASNSVAPVAQPLVAMPTFESEMEPMDGASSASSERFVAKVSHPSIAHRLTRWIDPWLPSIFYTWLLGALSLSMRPLSGLFFSRKLRTQGQSVVSDTVAHTLKDACELLRISRVVQIAQSTLVEVPSVVGYLNPLILLPASAITGLSQAELRTIIVHELAHVRRHDYLVNLFQTVIESLLFFHPMVWWLSSHVRTERENCCDDVVVDICQDRSEYIRALMQMEIGKKPGLAMAATNGSLVQRVRRIVGKQKTRTGNAWLAGLMVLSLLAILPLSRPSELAANQPDEESSKPESVITLVDGKIIVNVVDKAGTPIANAKVECEFDDDKRLTQTNKNGQAAIELANDPPGKFSIRVSGDFLALKATWDNGVDDEPDPIPGEINFQVTAGTKIGGRVLDQDGNAVVGATIKPAYYGLTVHKSKRIRIDWAGETRTTDKDGRWSYAHFQSPLGRFDAQVFHPKFANDSIRFNATEEQNHVFKMQPGVNVRGKITNTTGDPIANASIVLSPKYATPGSWTTQSNTQGEYEFRNVKPDAVRITVMNKNFAPKTKKVSDLTEDTAVNVVLEKGTPLVLKFVDANGDPVEGVHVTSTHWMNVQGLDNFKNAIPQRSNAEGVWRWENAPQGRVTCSFSKRGFLRHSFIGLEARSEPYEYKIHRVLNVSGSVSDKETGNPIEKFTVMSGNWIVPGFFGPNTNEEDGGIAWDVFGAQSMQNGNYEFRITKFQKKHFVKIEAPGYRPATSRAFANDEGDLQFDFQLEPSEGLKGQVLDQAGKPVTGAEVHYILPGRYTEIRSSVIEDGATIKAVTDIAGEFSLPEQDQEFAIMVIADDGYALVRGDEFRRAKQQIKISRWATIRGQCKIGKKPAAGHEVALHIHKDERIPDNLQYVHTYNAIVQEDGIYEIKRVPPNVVCEVGRMVRIERKSGGAMGAYSHTKKVTTKPTRVSRVDIGGLGRPVIGKVKLPAESKRKVEDWNTGVSSVLSLWQNVDGQPSSLPFWINDDLTFRIEDVPAGDYKFMIFASDMNASSDRFEIGRIESTFKVPAIEGGQSDEPFDVGELEVVLKEYPES